MTTWLTPGRPKAVLKDTMPVGGVPDSVKLPVPVVVLVSFTLSLKYGFGIAYACFQAVAAWLKSAAASAVVCPNPDTPAEPQPIQAIW